MIYIKEDENTDDNMVGYPNLIPGQMYIQDETICCYIGDNKNSKYNLVFLLFHDNRNTKDFYYLIEWTNWLKFTPLNINIKDYIIKNNLVLKTMKSLKKHEFSGIPNGISLKLIKKIYDSLSDNIDVSMFINLDKFNI